MTRKTSELKPLPGYPWRGKFQTMEEIEQYHNQAKLTCLLCGREYASLARHLGFTHDLEADQYREMYGLLWSKSLAGKDWREVQGQRLKRTRASGKISRGPPLEQIQAMLEAARHRRPVVEADRKSRRARITAELRQKVRTAPEVMEEYLRRIGTGRTISEVAKDADMPSFQSFYRHCSGNPGFLRRFEAIWDRLPFTVQFRGHKTGPRFKKTVIALRGEGKTWAEIGRIVGVVPRKAWHRWKKSEM